MSVVTHPGHFATADIAPYASPEYLAAWFEITTLMEIITSTGTQCYKMVYGAILVGQHVQPSMALIKVYWKWKP